MMQRHWTSALSIGGMVVSWAIYYAASKWMVGQTGSAFMTGLMLRMAALVFLTVQLACKHKLAKLLKQGKAALLLLLIGVFGYLLDAFANLGYGYSSLSTGTALLKTDVLMVNLATVILYKKKLYPSDWVGTLVMLVGVFLVLEIDWRTFDFNIYDLFFLASALCVTINAFIIKTAQDKHHVDTDMIAYYNNFTVLVLFLVSALVAGDIRGLASMGGVSFWGMTTLGGLAQTCIYFFYYRNLKRFEVWMVKLYLLLMPVVSCLIGTLLLDEQLSPSKVAGICVVLLGATAILLRDKLHPRTA